MMRSSYLNQFFQHYKFYDNFYLEEQNMGILNWIPSFQIERAVYDLLAVTPPYTTQEKSFINALKAKLLHFVLPKCLIGNFSLASMEYFHISVLMLKNKQYLFTSEDKSNAEKFIYMYRTLTLNWVMPNHFPFAHMLAWHLQQNNVFDPYAPHALMPPIVSQAPLQMNNTQPTIEEKPPETKTTQVEETPPETITTLLEEIKPVTTQMVLIEENTSPLIEASSSTDLSVEAEQKTFSNSNNGHEQQDSHEVSDSKKKKKKKKTTKDLGSADESTNDPTSKAIDPIKMPDIIEALLSVPQADLANNQKVFPVLLKTVNRSVDKNVIDYDIQTLNAAVNNAIIFIDESHDQNIIDNATFYKQILKGLTQSIQDKMRICFQSSAPALDNKDDFFKTVDGQLIVAKIKDIIIPALRQHKKTYWDMKRNKVSVKIEFIDAAMRQLQVEKLNFNQRLFVRDKFTDLLDQPPGICTESLAVAAQLTQRISPMSCAAANGPKPGWDATYAGMQKPLQNNRGGLSLVNKN
jgi:hypothetical protein